MTDVREAVAVWTNDAGEPLRIVWRSRRYRVTDVPTALVGPCDWWHPFEQLEIGYGRAPLAISGWRFQASADDGETHVFDVQRNELPERWNLVRVFD